MSGNDHALLLYRQPMLLRPDLHRGLRLAFDPSNYGFALHANSFLLALSELPQASLSYPVVFVGQPGEAMSLAVLVGLNDRQNLFVDPQGRWLPGHYIPAFVRRYPFLLVEGDDGGYSVGYDAGCAGFSTERGEPLFQPDGSHSPLLAHAIGYLESFHHEMVRTREWAGRLDALGLLVPRVVEISSGPGQAPRVLQGFRAVDPERLVALDDATLLSLARGPDLAWIHAHLNSLQNVGRLAQRIEAPRGAAAFVRDGSAESAKADKPAKAAKTPKKSSRTEAAVPT